MMGPTHRLLGGLAGVATAAASSGQPWSMVAMSGVVASASAHGWLSPDVDQTRPWVAVRKMLPSPVDQLLNHRALSHWWGLPLIAWWGIGRMDSDAAWVATILLVGWVSHLVGDFVFGTLPLLPWGGPTIGLSFKTGGFLESGRARVLGRERTVIPFGPTRAVITLGIVVVLTYAAAPDQTPGLLNQIREALAHAEGTVDGTPKDRAAELTGRRMALDGAT